MSWRYPVITTWFITVEAHTHADDGEDKIIQQRWAMSPYQLDIMLGGDDNTRRAYLDGTFTPLFRNVAEGVDHEARR